jgi:hypothetical protein
MVINVHFEDFDVLAAPGARESQSGYLWEALSHSHEARIIHRVR